MLRIRKTLYIRLVITVAELFQHCLHALGTNHKLALARNCLRMRCGLRNLQKLLELILKSTENSESLFFPEYY